MNNELTIERQEEPIIAYRGWKLVGKETLGSLGVSGKWPKLRIHASDCSASGFSHDENTPAVECFCGFYGFKEVSTLAQLLEYKSELILGRVALGGKVIETTLGYRASHAYPQVLFYGEPSADKETIQRVANAYGIEVSPIPVELAGLRYSISIDTDPTGSLWVNVNFSVGTQTIITVPPIITPVQAPIDYTVFKEKSFASLPEHGEWWDTKCTVCDHTAGMHVGTMHGCLCSNPNKKRDDRDYFCPCNLSLKHVVENGVKPPRYFNHGVIARDNSVIGWLEVVFYKGFKGVTRCECGHLYLNHNGTDSCLCSHREQENIRDYCPCKGFKKVEK